SIGFRMVVRYMLRAMPRFLILLIISAAALAAQAERAITANIPYADAKPILEALHGRLPSDLKGKTPAELESAWASWVSRRNRAIRARLEQGDEDSLFNFLLYGTTFTKQPRALNDSAKLGGRDRAAAILRERIGDMIAGIASPGGN